MLSVEWASPRSGCRVERPRARPDVVVIGGLAVLVALGLANLRALDASSLAEHQAAVVAGSIVLLCVLRRCRTASLRWLGWGCYAASIGLLLALAVVMLVLGRIPLRAIAALAGVAVLAAPLAEHLLRPYQLERLHAYLDGSSSGAGWTIQQAHIALAWGGQDGLAHHSLHLLLADYLPEHETDLAFASLVEQWRMRAGVLAALAAAAVVWRIALASRCARTCDAALFAAGLAALVGIEVGVSIAANLGLVPTAGVPFPLVSYGGTAVAVHLAAVVMVLALRADAQRRELWLAPRWRRSHPRLVRFTALAVTGVLVAMVAFAWQLQRTRGPALRA